MNHLPDVEPVLRAYLADTGDRAPDRVLADVAARIARQPRRPWRLRRRPFMSTYAKVAIAAAAVVIVAVVGFNLLPKQPGVGSSPPSASPSSAPSSAPSPRSPSPTLGSGLLPEGTLAAGHYTMPGAPELFGLTISVDVPAGWTGFPEVPAVGSPTKGSANGAFIGFMTADSLYGDPCHWNVDGSGSRDQPGDIPLGPTVDDVVSALRSPARSYTASAANPVTIGGFAGQQIELQLPDEDVLITCDRARGDDSPSYLVFGRGFWAQGAKNIWRLYVLDVDGTKVVAMLNYFAEVPAADVTAADAIIRSMEFAPAS